MKQELFFILLAGLCSVCCQNKVQYTNRAEAIAAQMHNPNSDYVAVACHRGDWRNFPENSAMAIESVIKMGADIMELDLKMTKDSVLVLSHDHTLDRCTSGKGRVDEYTLQELMQFNLKRAHGIKSDTTHILTLEQALRICKDRICVNVDQGFEYYDKVMEIAERLGVTDQILIKSKKSIDEVSSIEEKHENKFMYMPIIDIQKEKGIALFDSYIERGVTPLAYEVCWQSEDGTFQDICKKIIAQGSKVWVNTIWASLCGGNGNDDDAAFLADDPASVYQRYLDCGVSLIQTDRPELLLNFLKKKGRHNLKYN